MPPRCKTPCPAAPRRHAAATPQPLDHALAPAISTTQELRVPAPARHAARAGCAAREARRLLNCGDERGWWVRRARGQQATGGRAAAARALRRPGTTSGSTASGPGGRAAQQALPRSRGRWRTPTAGTHRRREESAIAVVRDCARGGTARRARGTRPTHPEIGQSGRASRRPRPNIGAATTARDSAARNPRYEEPPTADCAAGRERPQLSHEYDAPCSRRHQC